MFSGGYRIGTWVENGWVAPHEKWSIPLNTSFWNVEKSAIAGKFIHVTEKILRRKLYHFHLMKYIRDKLIILRTLNRQAKIFLRRENFNFREMPKSKKYYG